VISGLIAGYRTILKPIKKLWELISASFLDGRLRKVMAEFFTEVAVLLFVFPVLDFYIQHQNFGGTKFVLAVYSLSLAAIVLAGVLSTEKEKY
jgi:hypothetical protein